MFDNFLESDHGMSIGKIMILFYLFASSSAIFPLLSKQLKNELENNRAAQHILGFMTILALSILVSNGKFSIMRIFVYAIIGYLWFVLTTKLDLQWTILIMGSLMCFLIYQNTIDGNINERKNNEKYYQYIPIIIFLSTVIGTVLYSNKKEGQYGGGYDLMNFLIY